MVFFLILSYWKTSGFFFKKKNFMTPFYGWGSTASRLQPLWRGSLIIIWNDLFLTELHKSCWVFMRSIRWVPGISGYIVVKSKLSPWSGCSNRWSTCYCDRLHYFSVTISKCSKNVYVTFSFLTQLDSGIFCL